MSVAPRPTTDTIALQFDGNSNVAVASTDQLLPGDVNDGFTIRCVFWYTYILILYILYYILLMVYIYLDTVYTILYTTDGIHIS